MATQTYLGRFTIGSDNIDFTVDDAGFGSEALALTAGRYFIAGYTSEGTNQLVEHMDAVLAASTNYTNISVSFSYTTGKVTIARDSGTTNFTITWDDATLGTLLGFTGNLSGNYTYTGTNEARYVWRPDRPFSSYPLQLNRIFEPESTSRVHRGKDGTTSATVGSVLYRADLEYRYLDDARIFIPSGGSVNQELEKFFEDVISAGEHIRLFPDDTATTATDYVTVVFAGEDGEPIGRFSDWAERSVGNYNGLFDVTLPVLKVV